jgi:hypothetical protein
MLKLVIISLINLLLLLRVYSISISVNTSGTFYNCSDTCFINNVTESSVMWGTPTIENLLSGLEFIGNFSVLNTDNSPQIIGTLVHNNWPINGKVPDFISLNISIESDLDVTTIPFRLQVNETTNRESSVVPCPFGNNSEWFGMFNNDSLCCPYLTFNDPCSDRIKFITPFNLEYSFLINETNYTLFIDGIKDFEDGMIRESFITQEEKVTSGEIFARLIALCADNVTCDGINQCTTGECLDGFCQYNLTELNGNNCIINIPDGFNEDCYDTYCLDGDCVLDTDTFDNNVCSLPVPRRLDPQCYSSKCLKGFCKIDFSNNNCETKVPNNFDEVCYESICIDGNCELKINEFNNDSCKIKDTILIDLNDECFRTYCLNGICSLELFDNTTICIINDCEGNCVNGTCFADCTIKSDGSTDNSDTNLLWLLTLLTLLACLPLLCCYLLLPLLCIPLAIIIAKSIPESAAVITRDGNLTQALNSPLYEGLETAVDNPMYDL